jgi:hypothetical protein
VLALLALLSGFMVYVRMGSTTSRIGHLPSYAIIIAGEWVVFAVTLWGSHTAFVGYVARVLQDPRSLLWDLPVAVILATVLVFMSPAIVRVMGSEGWASLQGMLPTTGVEIAAWIVMSITAGICEETIFRGYLQQQISGWTGHIVIGIIGQAAVFGLCHAYQGWKKVVLIFVWGCVFGACAWLREGLRANMVAHAALDIFSAF